MPRLDSLVGGSYPARAVQADSERSINWFPAPLELPGSRTKTNAALVQKPGLALFCALSQAGFGGGTATASAIYALYQVNGRVFALTNYLNNNVLTANSLLWEIFSNGTATIRSTPMGQAAPYTTYGAPAMVANENQLLIAIGGGAYTFNLATNTFAAVSSPPWGSAYVASPCFLDGYFILRQIASQTYWVSNLNDATTWNALNFGSAEGQAGNIQGMIVDHRLLWFFMTDHAEGYYDAGLATGSPFARLDGAFLAQGLGAVGSLALCDNTFFWVSANTNQGYAQVFRAAGYTPQRISTTALENAMQSFPTVQDATGYAYQENGRLFYRLDFPSASSISGNAALGQTWVYDCSTGLWHERTWWNATGSYNQRDLAGCHTMLADTHLVGDYQTGNIYIQSQNYVTDNGAPIFRQRILPPFANGGRRTFYGALRLGLEVDLGLDGSPSSTPEIQLAVSNDGGLTFPSGSALSLGSTGNWNTLLRWPKLGSSFNRAFYFYCIEKVGVSLIYADLDMVHG